MKIGDVIEHEGAGHSGIPWVITAIEDVTVVNDGRPVCPYASATVRVTDQKAF